MKKIILIASLILLLIATVGCVKEESNEINNNQDSNNGGKVENVELVEEIEDEEIENKTITVKREDLGEVKTIRKMEAENISAENKSIKLTITDYKLSTLKPSDEYINYFKDFDVSNLEEIAILDINFKLKNLSSDVLELDLLHGNLTTNNGEEVPVVLDFFGGKDEDKFKFSGKEVKEGSISAILNSNPQEIKDFKFVYNDLEFNFE